MSKTRIGLGKRGEDAAAAYLIDKGYLIVSRNYRRRSGEIDIICKDGNCYVFIEVKTRQGTYFGDPIEAVTVHKQRQIRRTALDYLTRKNLLDIPVRFDVIGIMLTDGRTDITHIIDAFEAA